MSLRSQIQYDSGVDNEYLAEGIKFFKNSNRIERLILKFESALQYNKDQDTKRDVMEYIREMQKAKLDFEGVEQKFATGNKEEAKEEYKHLRIKFSKIITDINKESIKKFMIAGGLVALVFTVFSIIVPSHNPIPVPQNISPNGIAMPTKVDLTASERAIQAEIKRNNDMLKVTKDRIKSLDLFNKNQKLIERLASEQNAIQNKIGKS